MDFVGGRKMFDFNVCLYPYSLCLIDYITYTQHIVMVSLYLYIVVIVLQSIYRYKPIKTIYSGGGLRWGGAYIICVSSKNMLLTTMY